jgi:hypothetical protein
VEEDPRDLLDAVRRRVPPGVIPITGAEAAGQFAQRAFLVSRRDGKKMKEMLETVLELVRTRRGGSFSARKGDCHPAVPGTSWVHAVWMEEFESALRDHISKIKVS